MFAIGELSHLSGVPASAIRYYESVGLIRAATREGGKRRFDESAVAQLAVVQLAKQTGFTLDEIRQLIRGFGAERWRRLAEKKLKEIDETAARLKTMSAVLEKLLECRCFDLEACGTILQRVKPQLPAARRRKSPGS